MDFKIFEYLSEYVKNKYPMYYNAAEQKEFMSFIHMIASNSAFKKKVDDDRPEEMSVREYLESGAVNLLIDELVETYAQIKFTNIWAHFEFLCEYIKKVIVEKGAECDTINDNMLKHICRDIALSITNGNDTDYSVYMNGSYNDVFLNDFFVYREEFAQKCYKHVQQIINVFENKIKVSSDTTEYLIVQTSGSILKDFDIDDIVRGKCDEDIKKRYKFYVNKLIKKVKRHVLKVVNEMFVLSGVPVDEVVSDITIMAIKTGELSAFKIIDGKLDELIENYAARKRISLDPSAAKRHIRNKISGMNMHDMPDHLLDKKTEELFVILHKNHGFPLKEIEEGKHDQLIGNIFGRENMKYFSVEDESKTKDLEYKPKKRKMHKGSIILIILAILVTFGLGALGYTIVTGIANSVLQIVTDIGNIDNVSAVNDFDDFAYSSIYMVGTQAYEPTADNVLEFYSKLIESGHEDSNYNYLGFYRAYMNVKDDRLEIMDSMLDLVQEKAAGNPKYKDFYREISFKTSYLDFVFDRLEEMGFDDIKDEKYQKALRAYEDAMYDYPLEEPFKKLSEKDQKIIKEIMEKYREYSKKYEALLGQDLMDDKTNAISCETPNRGGRV